MAGKKRGNAAGTIYQLKDEQRTKRWVTVVTLPTGKRKYQYSATQAEAQRLLNKTLRERDMGLPGVKDERQTVAAYLASWLEMVKPQVRESGWLSYEERIRLYITPKLGRVKLTNLSPQHIRELHSWMLTEKQLSPTTVNHTHGVLHHALKDAVRMGVLSRNVCETVDPPRKAKRKMVIYTPEQVGLLLDAARGHPFEAIITTAVTTGARLGELLALRASAVDLDKGSITIHSGRAEVLGGFADTEPKTDAGNRTISITAHALAILRDHHKAVLEQRLWLGGAWQGGKNGYVFPNTLGDQLGHATVEHAFKVLLRKEGLPAIRFHDLRHTAASLMLLSGVPVAEVSRMLGHSSPHITYKIYAHSIPGAQKQAVAAMEAILGDRRARES
jgi:integrase